MIPNYASYQFGPLPPPHTHTHINRLTHNLDAKYVFHQFLQVSSSTLCDNDRLRHQETSKRKEENGMKVGCAL